jgi:hypothetical protein
MKTSLVLDDRVFEEAKKESLKTGKTVSEIISEWAAIGRDHWKKLNGKKAKTFKPLDLGGQKVDLTSRKEWMEELDDDRS